MTGQDLCPSCDGCGWIGTTGPDSERCRLCNGTGWVWPRFRLTFPGLKEAVAKILREGGVVTKQSFKLRLSKSVPWWVRWRPSVRRWLRETERRIQQELDNRPRRS